MELDFLILHCQKRGANALLDWRANKQSSKSANYVTI